jgi:hypothetical protein
MPFLLSYNQTSITIGWDELTSSQTGGDVP